MKVIPLSLLMVLNPSCCLAFVSQSRNGNAKKLLSSNSPSRAASLSPSLRSRRRLTLVSLADSPLESTSALISLGDVASSLQLFYTAALVAGVGYQQRMAGRDDFKKDMATKIATGKITPEELVDEITVMAEEINNEISESKSFAEAAQMEVQKILEETRAIQEQIQQIPDALNIEKAALAVERKAPPVKAEVQEKVLITAGGRKEIVTADGGRKEESAIPIGVVERFGEYDDVFEIEEGEEEEKEWSVPLAVDGNKSVGAEKSEESKESTQNNDNEEAVEEDIVSNNLVADALQTKEDEQPSPSSSDDTTAAIRQQAEEFRARIKQMEARISSGTNTTKQAEAKVTSEPDTSPAASIIEDVIPSDAARQAKEVVTSVPKPPSPPKLEPPAKVVSSVKNTTTAKRKAPDEPIRSSPLARLLCSELNVDLADVYPGSGLKGRVIADDVRNYANSRNDSSSS